MPMTRLSTAEEIAEFLNVTPETIRSLARNRKIPAIRIGHSWRFALEAVQEWLVQMQHQPTS